MSQVVEVGIRMLALSLESTGIAAVSSLLSQILQETSRTARGQIMVSVLAE